VESAVAPPQAATGSKKNVALMIGGAVAGCGLLLMAYAILKPRRKDSEESPKRRQIRDRD
jgi:hypothetical protein